MPSCFSSQNESVIEVSQDALTSPVSGGNVLVADIVEVVEDSVKAIPEAYRGGAVETPPSRPPEDEDELYTLSPQAKASHKRPQAPQMSGEEASPATGVNMKPAIGRVAQQNKSSGKSLGAHEAPPSSEIASDKPGRRRAIQTPKRLSDNIANDQFDELQVDDGGLSAPIGSQARSSRKQLPIPNSAQMSASEWTPSVPNAKSAPNGSSLAALRARHANGQGLGTAAISVNPKDGAPPENAAEKSKPVGKNAPSRVTATGTSNKSHTSSTTGRLQVRKGGMFARTPVDSKTRRRDRLDDDDDSDDNDILANGPPSTIRAGERSRGKGMLKAPSKQKAPQATKRQSTYDLDESSEYTEARGHARGAHKSKVAPARNPPGSTAKSAPTRQARQSIEPPKRSRNNANRQSTSTEIPQLTRNSLRLRMKAESNVEPIEHPEPAAGPKISAKNALKDGPITGVGENETAGDTEGRPETIEKFEDSVMHYEDTRNLIKGQESRAASKSDQEDPQTSRERANGDSSTKKRQTGGNCAKKLGTSQNSGVNTARHGSFDSPMALCGEKQPSSDLGDVVDLGSAESRLKVPKTPHIFGSSPPPTTTAPTTYTGPISAKKPTIVAFDKFGPQNQGTLSVKKGKPESTRANRSSVPPPVELPPWDTSSRVRLEERTKNGRSSRTKNIVSHRSNKSPAPSNVAGDVVDALAGFVNKASTVQGQEVQVLIPPADIVPPVGPRSATTLQPAPDNTDFMDIDDFDGPTVINEGTPPSASLEHETVSTVTIEDIARSSNVGRNTMSLRTQSQREMPPPPAPERSQRLQSESVPLLLPTRESGPRAHPSEESVPQAEQRIKRTHEELASNEPTTKRHRTSSTLTAAAFKAVEGIQSENVAQKSQCKPLSSQEAKKQVSNPTKQNSQRSIRQTSGSQKVDILGSPIPQGMIVEDRATVLDTYSQQAALSSDREFKDGIFVPKTQGAVHAVPTAVSHETPPPSRQPESRASNKKRRPSEPQEESQAVIEVVRGDDRRLLFDDQARALSTDPFTSSDKTRTPRQGSMSSNLFEQLRQEKQVEEVLGVSRRKSRQHDPDKTLVEPEAEKPVRKRKRAPSISTVTSDSSKSTTESSATISDLGAWRNALQPHQMLLFDELVIVSHRLIRHLVDKETATRDIVDDYHRRGLNLIEQMEATHAMEHQQCADRLKERKTLLRQEYAECSRKLQQTIASVEAARRERKEKESRRDLMVNELQQLMAQVC